MTHRNGSRVLSVSGLSRVEGEGAMHLSIENNRVVEVELNIYEPPRFFEALLQGRSYTEPPDITARICGICPVAYQMSACLAIEDACGVVVDGQLAALRRLLYCGEWIESHASICSTRLISSGTTVAFRWRRTTERSSNAVCV
jgi:sulfhydrogenase subunit alpha